jgi:hypothetical protein
VKKREELILQEITRRYLTSRDFNGIPLLLLAEELKIPEEKLLKEVSKLIQDNKLQVIFSDTDVNPHIIRIGVEPIKTQLEKLSKIDVHACGYPTSEHLRIIVNRHDFEGKPYTLSLALGEPQLSFKPFDLSVLEFYRNDPRYEYTTDDIHGQISITSKFYDSQQITDSDNIFLNTFGFCYDADLNRAVAVFIRYISDLSPEHQQIWKAKELQGDYKLHPDYYRNTILGDWGERIPIFEAFIMELQFINQMASAMGRPPLFRNDFSNKNKPREFSFLVRPTSKEYEGFVLLLDKLLSDNINKDFFMHEIPYEYEETRSDNKVIVHTKNTITLLNEWFKGRYHTTDWQPFDETIGTLREIRKQRQRPAHAIDDNVFDQQYIHKQRELISTAYKSVRTIRLMFSNHPNCKAIKINRELFEGKIWSF